MKVSAALILASLSLLASAAPAPAPKKAAPKKSNPPNQAAAQAGVLGAAFFMSNDPQKNVILASTIGTAGTLTTVRMVPTGGKGSHGNSTGPDALFSQGAVKVGANSLFAVNPGSNTLSMFAINPADPANIKTVGKPISTSGEFPMSVAVNKAGTMACVLNGGAKSGVACFKAGAKGLSAIPNTVRDLGLGQTTPPQGPALSASHAIFNVDETQLLAAIKGTPTAPGFVAVWDVAADGSLSKTFNAVTPPKGGALPFGMAVVEGAKNAIISTDPALGLTIMDLSTPTAPGKTTTAIKSLAATNTIAGGGSNALKVNGEDAVCWVAFSKATGTFFTSDIGTATITEVKVDPATLASSIVQQYPQAPGSATLDVAVGTVSGKDFLYILGANQTSVDVMSLPAAGKGVTIQNVNFAEAAKQLGVALSPDNVQGMTVFIPAA